jgi:hypothetical protein
MKLMKQAAKVVSAFGEMDQYRVRVQQFYGKLVNQATSSSMLAAEVMKEFLPSLIPGSRKMDLESFEELRWLLLST